MMFKEIRKLHKRGYKVIVGLDEAGRGPLAGPVIASAVALEFSISNFQFSNKFQILKSQFNKIRDSKKLSTKQREGWYKILTNHPDIEWGIGIVSEKIIDKVNILEATKLAMAKAVQDLESKLGKPANFLIIDGNFSIRMAQPRPATLGAGIRKRPSEYNQKAIVKADEKIFLCMAAGIMAKVTRDRMMVKLHKKYPQYGFERHKGYGTREHIRSMRKHGPCEIHRKTFEPIRSLQQKSAKTAAGIKFTKYVRFEIYEVLLNNHKSQHRTYIF